MKKVIMKQAHILAKATRRKGDNYAIVLGQCIKFIHSYLKGKTYKVVKTLNTVDTATNKIIDIKVDTVDNLTVHGAYKLLEDKYEKVSNLKNSYLRKYKHCFIAKKILPTGAIEKQVKYEVKEVL